MFNVSSYLKSISGIKPSLGIKRLMNSVSYLVVFMAVLSFVSSMVFKSSAPVGVVTSGSMMPVLDVGDIVFVQPSRLDDVNVGEVVAFYATPQTVVIHRVEKILILPGKIYLITKGDANDVTDQSVGFPPVREDNFVGKVLFIDGIPVKVPLLGQLWMRVYNFSVWLTQDKPWSFWAPVLASLYICWPALAGGKRIYQKHIARRKIDKTQIFTIAFIGFVGISLFTMWFRVVQYTLGMRIACLFDFPDKKSFNYGSMIYGQKQDNAITVTGAPMFPVKAVSFVKGNASQLSSVTPGSTIVESNTYLDLDLHTEVPSRGTITPGLYEGVVYVFSSSLWILLPDNIVFNVFNSFVNPWIAAVLLESLSAFMLASSITLVFLLLEFSAKQAIYTYVWLKRPKEDVTPPHHLLLIKEFRMKLRDSVESFKMKINSVVNALSVEGRVRDFKVFAVISAASYATYLILNSFLLSIILQGLVSGAYAVSRRLRQNEVLLGIFFEHIVYCSFLVTHNVISSIYSLHGPWSLASTGFAGTLFFTVTTPIAFTVLFIAFRALMLLRVWILEQETMRWVAFRRVKFILPNFERIVVEVIPREIDLWTYHVTRKITTFIKARRLVAESCRVIKPLEVSMKTPGKLSVESYVSPPAGFFAKLELKRSIQRRILTVEEYWISSISNLGLKGGKL